MDIKPVPAGDLLKLVDESVREVIRVVADAKRTGGFFCYALGQSLIGMWRIGQIADEAAAQKCIRNVLEKASRLAHRPDDVSSWQTRKPQEHQYGGAIRTTGGILSFSGLTEEMDETAMLLVAIASHTCQLPPVTALRIAGVSGNRLFPSLAKLPSN